VDVSAGAKDNLDFMRPKDIQQIGGELAVKWDDGGESFIALEELRRRCPCAGCQGERDILGNVYKNPEKKLSAVAFELKRIVSVGGYAIQPVWADGHATGIYSFDYLKRIAQED
jgi:DUF971 family protein